MPQNASKNYEYPPGTRGIPDETIESARYNDFLDDLVGNDLNFPRPIHRGGTEATTADQALINLGAEKATQLVTNYDSHVWLPGSFRSAGSATAGPVDGHAFAGIVYLSEPFLDPPTNANVVVSARDVDDTVAPSRVYVREKKANVWGAWTVTDATTLPFPPGGDISSTTVQAAIQELDTEKASIVYVDDEVADLLTHVDTADTTLQDNITAGDALKVAKAGDTMTGPLFLPSGNPTELLHAAHKQYVDDAVAAAVFANVTEPGKELRFTRSLNQHMTRLFTTTSSNAWTMSMWVQRAGSLGTHQALFGVESAGNKLHVGFFTDNSITLMGGVAGTTVLVGEMPPQTSLSLWYNIVWSAGAGAPGSGKLHTVQINNNGAWAMVALTTGDGANAAETHYIGQPGFMPDVVMKEVIFVDGSQVPQSSFGGTDISSGVWAPKTYLGPFGTNGFKLNFGNQFTPASTNLGKDISGNNNHWIAANF